MSPLNLSVLKIKFNFCILDESLVSVAFVLQGNKTGSSLQHVINGPRKRHFGDLKDTTVYTFRVMRSSLLREVHVLRDQWYRELEE